MPATIMSQEFSLPFTVKAVFYFSVFFVFFGLISNIAKAETKKNLPLLWSAVFFFWLLAQGWLAGSRFYFDADALPPRLFFAVLPPALLIAVLMLTDKGKQFIDKLSPKSLTYIHLCRIPVEFVLLRLFMAGAIPELMTFEGRNFDIITGATAIPLIFFAYKKFPHQHWIPLIWNFIGLALLLNVVINGITSAPGPFQLQAFDQPNYGVLLYPFIWLPSFIVPAVLFIHLVCIRHHIKALQSCNTHAVGNQNEL